MQRKEMHPLCCISIDCPGIGVRSPEPMEWALMQEERNGQEGNAGGESESDVSVAGALYKWTNFSKGWRLRWFTVRNGVLTYSKIRRREDRFHVSGHFRLIGVASARLSRSIEEGRRLKKPVGAVSLKLKTNSKEDRESWIKALVSARTRLSLPENLPLFQNDVSFSTENLKTRMRDAGISEGLIKDCEQIMQAEFLEFHRQLKQHYEEHLDFIGSYQQQLEVVSVEDDPRTVHDESLRLMKHDLSSSGHGKFSEYSTTESSDDVEKQEFEEFSDEEPCFFDTTESFCESNVIDATSVSVTDHAAAACNSKDHSVDRVIMTGVETDSKLSSKFPLVERRKKMPDPVEKEKGVSLWSMIKDNVGKDLTRVCLPVYFNEPLSSLQKCFEDLEYSHLLDKAYEYGKKGDSLMRILNVAAFAVSGYASSDGRLCKPFNPLLGETYEADFPEKGLRFFSEKVSHHPMLVACHCEGNGWKFWGDSNLKSKFWGQSIQLDPVGVLTLEFDDGEIFQWSKVTTTIYNLILGKVYCDHHGTMNIIGNRQYSSRLRFKEHTLLDRNPRQVVGFVEDGESGAKVSTLIGKWDEHIYCVSGHDAFKLKGSVAPPRDATLLWKKNDSPTDPTRYNLTSFAITLNELTPGLQEMLPPTDSRLRPDQRFLENGEYAKANEEKLRLEKRQRMSTKLQEDGWKPRWFKRDGDQGTFRYIGGYWEAREKGRWEGCPSIFGDFSSNSSISQA